MKTELTPSFNGKFLVVSYVVRLAIRHSSWNADQKGKVVEVPVWISHPPLEILQKLSFVPNPQQQQQHQQLQKHQYPKEQMQSH
jgi:hypothetical protein